MSDEKALAIKDESTLPAHWGDKGAIVEAANRIRAMMPGGDKLTVQQASAVAQASYFSDANFLRGDIYGYPDKDRKLVLLDGYKLLVREAKRVCEYRTFKFDMTDAEKSKEGLDPKDLGFWVYVLRDDRRADYQFEIHEAKEFGMDYHLARRTALDYTASKAAGFVRQKEMWSDKWNMAIDPP